MTTVEVALFNSFKPVADHVAASFLGDICLKDCEVGAHEAVVWVGKKKRELFCSLSGWLTSSES